MSRWLHSGSAIGSQMVLIAIAGGSGDNAREA